MVAQLMDGCFDGLMAGSMDDCLVGGLDGRLAR